MYILFCLLLCTIYIELQYTKLCQPNYRHYKTNGAIHIFYYLQCRIVEFYVLGILYTVHNLYLYMHIYLHRIDIVMKEFSIQLHINTNVRGNFILDWRLRDVKFQSKDEVRFCAIYHTFVYTEYICMCMFVIILIGIIT